MRIRAFSIGEAVQATGVDEHTLRYWERMFPAHLHPSRTKGGQRRYSAPDLEVVLTIKRLTRGEGFSLRGAGMTLDRQAATDGI